MRRILSVTCGVFVLALAARPALAQQTVAGWTLSSNTQIQIGENEYALNGSVEIEQGDTKLYAEHVDFFPNQDRAIATGNVLLSQGNNRIGADSADFNTKTRLGTFYHAYGIANVQPPRRAPAPGAFVPPPMAGQETDVYFFGDIVEKIGPKKYKITNGGFTTCVQPTARWDLYAETVVLHVNHYTMLRSAVLKVKGVPMLYLPFMYYPTKEDQRATGFLIPTYGVSTIRGQSIHNAFFWAINRSQDATILNDLFSKAGQGLGAEYRYNYGPTANGNLQTYFLNQKGDASTGLPDDRSFKIIGNANELLPDHLRARANVNYFSDLQTNQTFNMDVYNASSNQRQYGGNVVGAWRLYSLNATFNHTEYFYDATDSVVSGTTPTIVFSRNERPLFSGSQLYFSAGTQFAHLDNETKSSGVDVDKSLSRFDFSPQLRYPFKKWSFFTVNTSLAWDDTYYSRSQDPTTGNVVDAGLNRQYYTILAQITGPTFDRIWNTPNNHYAEKFKHLIEPVFNIQRISNIDDTLRSRILQSDSTDYTVGTTSLTYGINNRFYAKRKTATSSQAQEILTISLSQSYYTNADASQVDTSYQTSNATAPSNFSPIKLDVRAQPTTATNTTVHAEFDSKYKALRTLSVNDTYTLTNRLQTSVGWTRTFLIPQLQGFNDPTALTNYVNATINAQTSDNRVGIRYALYYDIQNSYVQQQRVSAFYNAQCCGVAFEYQTYNLSGVGLAVPSDNRFFFSITLAGLGNFSPFSGAMSGVPH